jgi:uroporphyrinogen decarboxylase
MTPREIVRHTLGFANPDRVARSFGESDLAGVSYTAETPATDWEKAGGDRWERIDEWGNIWARIDATSKGEVAKGILSDLKDIESLELPDYSNPSDYEAVRAARIAQVDHYLLGHLPGFTFNIARKLRRLDQYLVDLMMTPDRMAVLHDRIDALLEDMIRNYAAAGVDGVMFPEDWGTQAQLLIDPALWLRAFMPRFEKLCGLARDCGITVWMHSCGQIEAIVPHLMDAGIACLQFDQPELHGIDQLAAHQERGKITFWCPVDIQNTLPQQDEALIRARARELLEKLWRGRGGFIAGFYSDNSSLGLDPVWQEYACDEFMCRGVKPFMEQQGLHASPSCVKK